MSYGSRTTRRRSVSTRLSFVFLASVQFLLLQLSEECRQVRATLEQINAQLNNARASNGQLSNDNASLRGDVDRLTKELNVGGYCCRIVLK